MKQRARPYTSPQVLTVQEACAVLRIHRTTLYKAIKDGQIAAIRLGHTIRIPAAEIERFKALRPTG